MVSPESSHTTSLHQESRAVLKGVSRPSHGKSAEDVAVGDNDNVAVGGTVGRLANDGLVPLVSDLLDQSV